MGSWNQPCYPLDRLVEMADRPVEPLDIAKLPIIEGRAHQQDVASMAAAMAQSEQEEHRVFVNVDSRLHPTTFQSHRPSTNTAGLSLSTSLKVYCQNVCLYNCAMVEPSHLPLCHLSCSNLFGSLFDVHLAQSSRS